MGGCAVLREMERIVSGRKCICTWMDPYMDGRILLNGHKGLNGFSTLIIQFIYYLDIWLGSVAKRFRDECKSSTLS